MKFKILISTLVIILSSCSSFQQLNTMSRSQNRQNIERQNEKKLKESMNSWVGSSKNNLLIEWGEPQSVNSDGNGGELLTFTELKRAYFDNFGYITVIHKYIFYINSNNKVYNWRYKKEGRQGM